MTKSLTHLEEAIQKAEKAHADRLAKLKRAATAEQRRIDARVLSLLRTEESITYDRLVATATEELNSEQKRRSRSATREDGSVSDGRDPGSTEESSPGAPEERPWT